MMARVVRGSWRLLSSELYRIGTTLMRTGTQTQDPKTDTMVPSHKHVATQNTKCTKDFHKVHLKPGAHLQPGVCVGGVQGVCFPEWQKKSWACQWVGQEPV